MHLIVVATVVLVKLYMYHVDIKSWVAYSYSLNYKRVLIFGLSKRCCCCCVSIHMRVKIKNGNKFLVVIIFLS